MGLNGIQIYDEKGFNILEGNNSFWLRARPKGVCVLKKMEKDCWRVENLLKEKFQSDDYKDIFLAPYEFMEEGLKS